MNRRTFMSMAVIAAAWSVAPAAAEEFPPKGTINLVVGFAAETDDIEAHARAKLEGKRVDLICANRVGCPGGGFESDDNALAIYGHGIERALGPAPKSRIAEALVALVAERLRPENL